MDIIKKIKRREGVTLIELLLVSSMMVLIGVAVYGVFSLALNVYSRIETGKSGSDIVVFSEKLADDLRNLRPFPEFDFNGTPDGMTFHVNNARYLISPSDAETSGVPPVSRVEYSYEPSFDGIVRRTYKYGHREPYSVTTVLSGEGQVLFGYVKPGEKKGMSSFFEEHISTAPRAVKIEVIDAGAKKVIFRRIVDVPITGM
ncbi:MAG: hypothetical protein WCV56_04430 [Candidatus Omnitrophota bacterium]